MTGVGIASHTGTKITSKSSKISKLLFLIYIVFCLAVISYVPKLIPLSPSAADSYVFGYNNTVGIALIFILIAGGVVWTKGFNLTFLSSRQPQALSNLTLILALIAVLCGCMSMYLFAGRYGGFGESYYLIDRIFLLSQGKVPYRDFEFAYGPGLLYGPLILKHVLPLDICQAYYLFWLINCLLGTLLLFKSVNLVNYPTDAKETIFLLLFFAGLFSIVRMGTNYTFLRFSCPVFFVLVIQRVLNRPGLRAKLLGVLLSLAFTAILILISPEIAIAFAFASVCICLFSRSEQALLRVPTLAVLSVAFSHVFWAAARLRILDTLLADGGGAISFPILIAPHIVVYLVALFVCACYIFRRWRNRRIDDNTLGLLAFSLPLVAAALGRCDPGHVFWNGLAIFLASMCYVSNYPRAWRAYRIAFVLFVFLLPDLTELFLFSTAFKQVSALNAQEPDLRARLDLDTLYPHWPGKFLAPFGYRPGGVATYQSSRIEYGRFEEFINVSTPHAVAQKVGELDEHPDRALILPDQFENLCEPNVDLEKLYISLVFLSPFRGAAAHSEGVRQPVCDSIRDRYRLEQPPTAQSFGYGLWVPKTEATQSR
jgi:hypothetical protein